MRDFRDAKAMAHTLRAGLAARGLKITNSQSLELIAEALGVADWNTLSAAIRAEVETARNNVSPPPPVPTAEAVTGPRFSRELESTLHRALAHANQRKHEYSTLEHLLLALIDEPDASAVMRACGVDLGVLKDQLASYLDNDLRMLVIGGGSDAQPTAAFQRVVQRAVIHIQVSGRHIVTGANLLVAVFAETQSPAASLLAEQGMTRLDAVNFIAHGIVKGSGGATDGP
jgi:Glyoxalase superfamily protein/Clp amino terminal domain, pathogenicity island component